MAQILPALRLMGGLVALLTRVPLHGPPPRREHGERRGEHKSSDVVFQNPQEGADKCEFHVSQFYAGDTFSSHVTAFRRYYL